MPGRTFHMLPHCRRGGLSDRLFEMQVKGVSQTQTQVVQNEAA